MAAPSCWRRTLASIPPSSRFCEPSTAARSRCRSSIGTPNGYEFYLKARPASHLDKQVLEGRELALHRPAYHDTYDATGKARDLSRHMKNVNCAVMTVGGWFDAEDLAGPLRRINAIEKANPGTPNTLVEGPWVHGGWARCDGDHLWRRCVQREDRRVLPQGDPVSVF